METKELRCSACGAALHYKPGQAVITCSHCGTEYAVDDGAAVDGPVLQPTGFAGDAPTYEAEVLALLRAGQLIEAVKVVRAHTGLGLRESKELTVALAAREGIDIPAARNRACAVIAVALLFLVVAAIIAAFILARVG